MGDASNDSLPASVLSRWWFRVTGKFACWWYGEMDVFPALVAQADLETGGFTSHWFKDEKNPFGMHFPTPGAVSGKPGDGGTMAVYSSYWAAWVDRLKWDVRHGANGCKTTQDYVDAVIRGGYNTNPGYKDAWYTRWDALPWYTRMWGASWNGTEWYDKLAGAVKMWLLIGLLLTCAYYIIKLLRNGKKGG